MKNTITALYCRISRDDDKNELSSSIKTQKDFLKQYANRMKYTNTKFYIDEGYTGTNFDRPGFQALIQDVEEGKIGIVLTKDLSRLGRNYLSTGYYIEHYFPSKNVRYIAINDNVDTDIQNNDFTPFKNIINEWYARDISRKIKSAYKTKAENGKFTGPYAPYGYKKHENDKNHLVVDKETSKNIVFIFQSYLEGMTVYWIIKNFEDRKILKPRIYKFLQYSKINSLKGIKYPYTWYPQTILNILSNEVYLGHIICNKQQTKSYKDRSLIDIPKENWIITKGVHEPIITADMYDKVQKIMSTKPKRKNIIHSHLFKSKIYCNDCGKAMTYSVDKRRENYRAYICSSYRVYGKSRCTTHHIKYEEVETQVQELMIRMYIYIKNNKDRLIQECFTKGRDLEGDTLDEKKLETNKYRKLTVSNLLKNLYEDFSNNMISQDVFNELSRQYRDEQKYLENKIQNHIDKTLDMENRKNELQDSINNVLSYDYNDSLTKELVDKVIDRVIILDRNDEHSLRNRVRILLKNIGEVELP